MIRQTPIVVYGASLPIAPASIQAGAEGNEKAIQSLLSKGATTAHKAYATTCGHSAISIRTSANVRKPLVTARKPP